MWCACIIIPCPWRLSSLLFSFPSTVLFSTLFVGRATVSSRAFIPANHMQGGHAGSCLCDKHQTKPGKFFDDQQIIPQSHDYCGARSLLCKVNTMQKYPRFLLFLCVRCMCMCRQYAYPTESLVVKGTMPRTPCFQFPQYFLRREERAYASMIDKCRVNFQRQTWWLGESFGRGFWFAVVQEALKKDRHCMVQGKAGGKGGGKGGLWDTRGL